MVGYGSARIPLEIRSKKEEKRYKYEKYKSKK